MHVNIIVGERSKTVECRERLLVLVPVLVRTSSQFHDSPVVSIKFGEGGKIVVVTPVLLMAAISNANGPIPSF